jgi:hypothetical protein
MPVLFFLFHFCLSIRFWLSFPFSWQFDSLVKNLQSLFDFLKFINNDAIKSQKANADLLFVVRIYLEAN